MLSRTCHYFVNNGFHTLVLILILIAAATAFVTAAERSRIQHARSYYSPEKETPDDFLFAIRKGPLVIDESKDGWFVIDHCQYHSGDLVGQQFFFSKIENDELIFVPHLKIPRNRIAYITRFSGAGK